MWHQYHEKESFLRKCEEKFRKLRQACAPTFPLDLDSRITNLSSHHLTLTEKQALCLGLDLAIAPHRSLQITIDSEFESLFQQPTCFDPLPEEQHAFESRTGQALQDLRTQ